MPMLPEKLENCFLNASPFCDVPSFKVSASMFLVSYLTPPLIFAFLYSFCEKTNNPKSNK